MALFLRAETVKDAIQADFDRLARLPHAAWDVNSHYHAFLLRQLPSHCCSARDIGCGTGAFARLLAACSDHVLALDLSPAMLHVAQDESRAWPNIEFQLSDVTASAFPPEHFDCIASIATMHHLPLSVMLEKCKHALKPGGVLIILDLVEGDGWRDAASNVVAAPWHLALMLVNNRRLRPPREVREAWAQHGSHDCYPTLGQVQAACAQILPGARVRKHLLWRYSIVWTKPASLRASCLPAA